MPNTLALDAVAVSDFLLGEMDNVARNPRKRLRRTRTTGLGLRFYTNTNLLRHVPGPGRLEERLRLYLYSLRDCSYSLMS
jgi:hypothetical protein